MGLFLLWNSGCLVRSREDYILPGRPRAGPTGGGHPSPDRLAGAGAPAKADGIRETDIRSRAIMVVTSRMTQQTTSGRNMQAKRIAMGLALTITLLAGWSPASEPDSESATVVPRHHHAMTYDLDRKWLVIFGGDGDREEFVHYGARLPDASHATLDRGIGAVVAAQGYKDSLLCRGRTAGRASSCESGRSRERKG